MASSGSSGAQLLICNGILNRLRIPLRDFVDNSQHHVAEQRTEWDDGDDDSDDSFPSLSAMEAVLDVLEVREMLCFCCMHHMC